VLKFVRGAVERCGGTVEIEGAEADGTTVTVRLPGRSTGQ
jgi:signal transduction histidine kinase